MITEIREQEREKVTAFCVPAGHSKALLSTCAVKASCRDYADS
jgi:hypothetical protein